MDDILSKFTIEYSQMEWEQAIEEYADICQRLDEKLFTQEENESQPVALLYVDSTREMMDIERADIDVMGQDASFGENESLFIKGCDVLDFSNSQLII